jgi:pimeloyl-ACP methyl ester carboxylesterase
LSAAFGGPKLTSTVGSFSISEIPKFSLAFCGKAHQLPMRCYPDFSTLHDSIDEPLIIHQHGNLQGRALVVFIHGLRGTRYGTWTPKRQDPRQVGFPKFLYDDVAELDVGLYAYRTALGRLRWWRSIELEDEAKVLADRLRDCAKVYRSIILAGHSMGGILARAAVHELIDRGDSVTLASMSGLLMLASPMAGSLRVPGFLWWVSADMRALRAHGPLISRTAVAFADRVVASATKKENLNQFVIPAWVVAGAEDNWVDRFSAGLGISRDRINNVRGSHTSVVKPRDRTDDVYDWVLGIIIGATNVSLSGSPPQRPPATNKVILTIEAPTLVDELAIHDAYTRFREDWPAVEIRWPNSAHELMRVLREALGQFDKGAGSMEGAHEFAANVPKILALIPKNRCRAEETIPSIVKRVRNLSERQRINAVTSFLRYANLMIHSSAAYYSGWNGLSAFELQAPAAWTALRGPSEETVAAVLGKPREALVNVRLRRVAKVWINAASGVGMYMYVPERFATAIGGRPYDLPIDELLWWAIPQLEYDAGPNGAELPDAYSTDWTFDNISGQ